MGDGISAALARSWHSSGVIAFDLRNVVHVRHYFLRLLVSQSSIK